MQINPYMIYIYICTYKQVTSKIQVSVGEVPSQLQCGSVERLYYLRPKTQEVSKVHGNLRSQCCPFSGFCFFSSWVEKGSLVPLQIQLCSSFEQICLLVVPKGNTLSSWRYCIILPPKPSFIVMLLVVTLQGSCFLPNHTALWTMRSCKIPQNDHRVASSPPKCCYRSRWVPLNPPRNTPFVSHPRDMPHHSRRA